MGVAKYANDDIMPEHCTKGMSSLSQISQNFCFVFTIPLTEFHGHNLAKSEIMHFSWLISVSLPSKIWDEWRSKVNKGTQNELFYNPKESVFLLRGHTLWQDSIFLSINWIWILCAKIQISDLASFHQNSNFGTKIGLLPQCGGHRASTASPSSRWSEHLFHQVANICRFFHSWGAYFLKTWHPHLITYPFTAEA